MTKICRFILAQTHPEGKDDVDVSAIDYHCKFMIVACLYNSQLQYDRCLKSKNMNIMKEYTLCILRTMIVKGFVNVFILETSSSYKGGNTTVGSAHTNVCQI